MGKRSRLLNRLLLCGKTPSSPQTKAQPKGGDSSTSDVASGDKEDALSESGAWSESASPEHTVASQNMALYCFQVLVNYFYGSRDVPQPSFTNDPHPVFVTWSKGPNRELRGCMGCFDRKPLHKNLAEVSIDSATGDSRFQPITLGEVPELHCTLSILTHFHEARHSMDWEIGVHGIRIYVDTPEGTLSSTFLPEVASEKGWTKLQTIDQLLQKAGCTLKVNSELLCSMRLVRYRTERVTVNCEDYVHYVNGLINQSSC